MPRHAPRPNPSSLTPQFSSRSGSPLYHAPQPPRPISSSPKLPLDKTISFELLQPATRHSPRHLHLLVPPQPPDHKTDTSCEGPCEATPQPRKLHITPPLQDRFDDLPLHFERNISSSCLELRKRGRRACVAQQDVHNLMVRQRCSVVSCEDGTVIGGSRLLKMSAYGRRPETRKPRPQPNQTQPNRKLVKLQKPQTQTKHSPQLTSARGPRSSQNPSPNQCGSTASVSPRPPSLPHLTVL